MSSAKALAFLKSSPVAVLGIAGIAYLLIRKLIPEETFKAADAAAAAVAKAAGGVLNTAAGGYADAYTAAQKALQLATRDGSVKVSGKIILPGAQAIDPASVKLTVDAATNTATFAYAGNRYQLMTRNSEGNYPAKVI